MRGAGDVAAQHDAAELRRAVPEPGCEVEQPVDLRITRKRERVQARRRT